VAGAGSSGARVDVEHGGARATLAQEGSAGAGAGWRDEGWRIRRPGQGCGTVARKGGDVSADVGELGHRHGGLWLYEVP